MVNTLVWKLKRHRMINQYPNLQFIWKCTWKVRNGPGYVDINCFNNPSISNQMKLSLRIHSLPTTVPFEAPMYATSIFTFFFGYIWGKHCLYEVHANHSLAAWYAYCEMPLCNLALKGCCVFLEVCTSLSGWCWECAVLVFLKVTGVLRHCPYDMVDGQTMLSPRYDLDLASGLLLPASRFILDKANHTFR